MSVPSSLQVKVKPNAREDRFVPGDDGVWLASLKAQPVDGKANDALIALVAAHFSLRKNQITIKSGAGARIKRLLIAP
ncbi:DUF167 domain-containing protein [Arenimonas sp. GDDSR-1]|uniref:DUF167 domain-containing protein n=1 Tax=Arenimonas sp. GDDSR-1 TaxID=2950125 RepID=UPI002630EF4D|nr:DUF167 domain-containing protein [Arenimonas sp. GDDSR-1]